MKKWLKRYGRWVFVCFGVLILANSIWGITRSFEGGKEVYLVVHTFAASLWFCIILMASGIAKKIYKWWEKD